ncbi:MAG: hypothetical protein PUP93_13065 [Rhizonema sp. NSF051]|nr:hypothetical protein [Rhizonema sp. NSF051]
MTTTSLFTATLTLTNIPNVVSTLTKTLTLTTTYYVPIRSVYRLFVPNPPIPPEVLFVGEIGNGEWVIGNGDEKHSSQIINHQLPFAFIYKIISP